MKIPLPVQSYRHVSRPVGTERLVNMYAEASPQDAKNPVCLIQTPGIVTGVTPGVGPGRGLFKYQGLLYTVSGATLYSITSLHASTSIGSVTGSSICTFAENATQMVICDPTITYTYDGTTLSAISDADFANGAQCGAIDGYIVFREPNSGRWFCSDLSDARSYDALNYATAEGLADNIVGIIVDHRQVILAGETSMEIWYNSGISGFPFVRDANGFIELGCKSGATLAKADNSIYWLASDLTVRKLDGLTPTRISQHGVEAAIKTYVTSDAQGFTYTQNGHIFYVLNFPTSAATWVYDATTQEWHERQSYGLDRWRPCATVFCYDRWYVQDFETGKVGYLDTDVYDDWADTKRWEMTFPAVYNNGRRLVHGQFSALFETGVGLVTGQGSDPRVTLEYSNDGGRTWRTSATKSMGLIGQYLARVIWDRLGSAIDRVYRLSGSDPVKTIIADAMVDIQ